MMMMSNLKANVLLPSSCYECLLLQRAALCCHFTTPGTEHLAGKQSQGLLLAHQHCHVHSVRIWGVSGISLVILQSFQRPSASGRVAQEQVANTGSSCRLSTCLRCPYTPGTADARLWPYTHFNRVNIGPAPSQLPPEPAHTFPSLPSPTCGTAACGEHRKFTWGLGNLENTCIWVIFVRLGTISPKTAYNQINYSDFINIEVTLNDCVKLWSSSETICSKRCSGTR